MVNKTNQNIALFPLKLFLLPGDYAQLYIFEERYKQLIADSTENEMPFGIAFTDVKNKDNIGSMVEVAEVLKVYPGGEMDITVRATSLFRLLSFNLQKEGKLYPAGDVDLWLDIDNTPASPPLLAGFKMLLLKNSVLNAELLAKDQIGILDIANEIMLTDEDKLEFVLCNNPEERDQYLINYLRFIQLQEAQEKSVYNDIHLN